MRPAGAPATSSMLASASRLARVPRRGPIAPRRTALLCVSSASGSGRELESNSVDKGASAQTSHDRFLSFLNGAQLFHLDGSLVVDDDKHRALVQQAHRERKLSFGFSAGGCLFPYYVGVAGGLQDAGVLTEDTKLGGASAGSLVAACIKCGLHMDEVIDQCVRMMHDCRVNGTLHRLGPLLEQLLEESLPEDAHERCRERAYVAVTRALPYVRAELVTHFKDREDLIRALRTSCHIPWYLDGRWVVDFRGQAHVDGGLTNFIPIPPGTVGVRVCCFPSKQLSRLYRIGISPDSFEPWPYSLAQMVRWALEPASEEFVTAFIEKGRQDATAWCKAQGLLAEAETAEEAAATAEGEAAAARAAAAGTSDAATQERQAAAEGRALHAKGMEEQRQERERQQKQRAEAGKVGGEGGGGSMLAKAVGAAGVAAAAAVAASTLGGGG